MDRIINKIQPLLERMRARDALAQLSLIRQAANNNTYRVAIVGGFSRGKTHFLNLLLNTELLPEDVLPTTTVLTEISWSERPKIEFVGEKERFNLKPDPSELDKFSANNEYADLEGILKIGLPVNFLKDGLHLYDTPGIDDILTERADITFQALRFCDAALVLTSASAPLGLDERQFIEEYLYQRRVPRIALVASFLDQLKTADVPRQLKNIRSSMLKISPDIGIWSAEANLPPDLCDVSGIESIRAKLLSWSKASENSRLKMRQLNEACVRLLKTQVEREHTRLQLLQMEVPVVLEKAAANRTLLNNYSDEWLEIRDKFMDASLRNAENLQKIALDAIKNVDREGGESLSINSRSRLREITSQLANSAQKNFNEDVTRLLGTIRQKYGLQPDLGTDITFVPAENDSAVFNETTSYDSLHLFMDLMDKHVDEIIMWMPIPVIGQKIAREIARRFLLAARRKISESEQNQEKFNQQINAAAKDLRQILRESYGQIAIRILEVRDNWLKENQKTLDQGQFERQLEQEICQCKENISDIHKLLEELKTAILTTECNK